MRWQSVALRMNKDFFFINKSFPAPLVRAQRGFSERFVRAQICCIWSCAPISFQSHFHPEAEYQTELFLKTSRGKRRFFSSHFRIFFFYFFDYFTMQENHIHLLLGRWKLAIWVHQSPKWPRLVSLVCHQPPGVALLWAGWWNHHQIHSLTCPWCSLKWKLGMQKRQGKMLENLERI